MLHPFEARFAEAWPPSDWAEVTVLAAVSGGGDSVALLRAMAAVKSGGAGRLCVAHLNHRLRPGAEDDERFVVDLCRRLGIACEVGQLDSARLAGANGIEAAARAARYRFLEKVAGRCGARFVATAHTADDQAETILHRIVRGTGIRGLSGMARTRPLGHAVLIRPLLTTRRDELIAYLDAIRQPYRHDPSNSDPRFTRNRIRHQLLPRLKRHFNAEAVESLLRLGSLAGEAQAVIDDLVDESFDGCVSVEGAEEIRIDLVQLAVRSGADIRGGRYLVRELLMAAWRRAGWTMQSMGMLKWDELCQMALSPTVPAKSVFPGGIVVEVTGGEMRLAKRDA